MSTPTTSIVILTRNQLEHTRACVASIGRHTPEPIELVFVDNGSTDDTLEFLRSIDGAVVIDNDRNLGFGAGCNQGIAASTGERVLLLNNDVVVTDGWLSSLHGALDRRPDAGIAGPRSNRVAGVQQVDDVGYDVASLEGLDAWAAAWRDAHAGDATDVARLVGFCLLVERGVIDRIGGFDLRYGLGNFEDDDFCLRAGVAGFRCVIAQDSWVHHVGSRTFVGEGIDYAASMGENLRRFAAAWRIADGELDTSTGAYRPGAIVARTTYDAARHYAPLVAVRDEGARLELQDARGRVLALCCDRLEPDATRHALEVALESLGPDDDITLAIRISPRDDKSMALLEAAADRVGDDALPDITVVEATDEHDGPLLRRADTVLTWGRQAAAQAALARHVGCDVLALDAIAARAWGPRAA